MKQAETGGFAFPQLDVVVGDRDGHGDAIDAYTAASGGMTLRDYFAGQALIGMMRTMVPYSNEYERNAFNAYKQADAMLAARSRTVRSPQ